MLGRNTVYSQGNTQPKGGFGRGLYERRGGQIMWRPGGQYREEYQNRGGQLGLARMSQTSFRL